MTLRQSQWRRLARTRRRTGAPRAARSQLKQERARQRAEELEQRRAALNRYRGIGDRRGQRGRFAGRILLELPPEPFEVSTGTLEAAYPFQITSRGHGGQPGGIAIGPAPTGGTFTWDPWIRYRQGRLANPNVLILGDVGSGKSSLAKTLVWRGIEFGRGAHIIDPKGEYTALAAAVGVDPVRLTPGSGVVRAGPRSRGSG